VLATSLGLGADVRNGVLAMDSTEVSEDLTCAAATLQQNGLASSGALEGKLIEGDDLTARLLDTGTSRLSNVEGSHSDLRDSQNALVISDGSDDNKDGIGRLILGMVDNLLDGHRGSVVAGHNQTTEDNGVEVGLSTTSQELVQLHALSTFIYFFLLANTKPTDMKTSLERPKCQKFNEP
jgi:hypothetical protein